MKILSYIAMALFFMMSLVNGILCKFECAIWFSTLACFALLISTIFEDNKYVD